MSRWSAGLALVAAVALFGAAEVRAGRHALLIGVSSYYQAGLQPPLQGVEQDLELTREVLRERLGFRDQEILTLSLEQTTHTGIERAFVDLARAVAPGDFVYVHYSGHGSLTPDFNDPGSDPERGGMDQTLVGYKARWPTLAPGDLDRFDILDDELSRWLGAVAAKAGLVVFVSDSCHSATNSRGEEAPVARAAPPQDGPEHPRVRDPYPPRPTNLIHIGAAGDDQQAGESKRDDGRSVGRFTWHWVSALRRAGPGATWVQVFEHARAAVERESSSAQTPRITEYRDGLLRLGLSGEPPPLAVTESAGERVAIGAGRLAGVVPGSLYATVGGGLVRIEESAVDRSRGRVESGRVAVGDTLVERERAYQTAPIVVFALPPQAPGDAALVERLRESIGWLPGFAWGPSQARADLVLAVLRPLRVDGVLQYGQGPGKARDSLPRHDPGAAPEVWVLTADEHPIGERLQIPLEPADPGIAALTANLKLHRHRMNLKALAAETEGAPGITLEVVEHRACRDDEPRCGDGSGCRDESQCVFVHSDHSWHRPIAAVPGEGLAGRDLREDAYLSFRFRNTGRAPRRVYLFELNPDGSVYVIYPRDQSDDAGEPLGPGESRDLSARARGPRGHIGERLDAPGGFSLLLVATERAIDPQAVEQGRYEPGRRQDNPLERLLAETVGGGTRSPAALRTGSWGARVFDFTVKPRTVTQGGGGPLRLA